MPEHEIQCRSHYLGGRYENLYVAPGTLPEVKAILGAAVRHAARILARPVRELRAGWWLNIMRPGDVTCSHTHDDADELLSGVYYIYVPPDSGRLVLMAAAQRVEIEPQAGEFVFFSPDVLHEVTRNESNRPRLSMGLNVGPVQMS